MLILITHKILELQLLKQTNCQTEGAESLKFSPLYKTHYDKGQIENNFLLSKTLPGSNYQ